MQFQGLKVRASTKKDSSETVYSLAVPPAVAQQIPEEARFSVELTEDGILYRIIKKPSWAKEELD